MTGTVYLNAKAQAAEQDLIKIYCARRVRKKAEELQSLLSHDPASYDVFAIQQIYEELYSAFKKLVPPVFYPNSMRVKEWLSRKVKRNYYPEGLKFQTQRGEKVRSKLEVIIADTLYSMDIPYQYELPMAIDNSICHPDFTILDPHTGRFVLVEALGLMDQEDYFNIAVKKIHAYEAKGFAQGKNLFLAFDTPDSPFDPLIFRKQMAERFF